MERKLGAAFMVDISGRMEGNPRAKLSAAWREGVQLPVRDVLKIRNSSFDDVIEAIGETPREYSLDAHFMISSGGGDTEQVRVWKRFMSAIRSTEGRVSTQVLGAANSSAAWTFMLGDPGHRFMTHDGRLGLHNLTLQLGTNPPIDTSNPLALREWAQKNIEGLISVSGEMRRDTESFLAALPAQERERILHEAFRRTGEEIFPLHGHELTPAGVILLTNEEIMDRVLEEILKLQD